MTYYRNKGFTLVEALLATLILSAGIVVISQLIKICSDNDSVGVDYEQAWNLLNIRLNELSLEDNLDELIAANTITVQCPDHPGFSYKLKIKAAQQQHLYEVTGSVTFQQGVAIYQAQQTIYISDPPEDIPADTDQEALPAANE
ncbi:MAG: prepilin-type N-terminal cleavage/methylation domain-containing protein [Phycisphaerae bacterium]|nr:prepilin-type N-terminal cleavage/methylation domain-containing protein [Phycisphaerae bacterium]